MMTKRQSMECFVIKYCYAPIMLNIAKMIIRSGNTFTVKNVFANLRCSQLPDNEFSLN